MTKNIRGGKNKKRGARTPSDYSKREIILRETGQEYALVEKMLGDMRCQVICSDKSLKTAHIRGKFKRRVWINIGDVVLISDRDFEMDKKDIIHKYTKEEAEYLENIGHFSLENIKGDNIDTEYNISILEENNDDENINLDDL